MKNKGFTLVELLAVITIIGLLGLITVPIVNDVIKNSDKKAFKQTLNAIIDTAKIYNASNDYLVITNEKKISVLDENLTYENKSQIKEGMISYENGKYSFDYIFSDKYCATGFIEEIKVYDISSTTCDNLK